MATDARLSLMGRVPSAAQSIGIFEQAKNNQLNRDATRQQMEQSASLFPAQQQIQQQQIAAGEAQAEEQAQLRIMRSVSEFAPLIRPELEKAIVSGETGKAQQLLTKRFQDLASQGLPTDETVEAITQLRLGNAQGVLEDVNHIDNAYQQRIGAGGRQVQSSSFIPGVGFATLNKSGDAVLVPVKGVGETKSETREADIKKASRLQEIKAAQEGKTTAVKAAIKKGANAFDRLEPLSTAILNYDEAISAIDQGAETGFIDSMMPSFKKASIELDNVKKRLGLDVVGNTTFGALSESELDFALSAALPDTLQPGQLREWLVAKRDAQKKVKERLEEAAIFLSDGAHTVGDWVEYDRARQINKANTPNAESTPANQLDISQVSDEDLFK